MNRTTRTSLLFSGLAALAALPLWAAYPGNPNFRNVSTTTRVTTRTDWVTNILDDALSTPFDWSKGNSLAPGVTHVPVILTTAAGWPRQMVCYCVRIDLTTPGLRFTGTDRCPEGWGDPMQESNSTCAQYESGHYPKRTVREKTSDFLARNRGSKSKGGKARNAVLAWNGAAWLPWTGANTNLWACPYSPLYSDGIQISNNRTGGVQVPNLKDPAPQAMFIQLKNGACGIIDNMTEDFAKMTWFCVPAFVTGLVAGGWADLDNDDVGPRTAMGISQDGKTGYVLVCDGRRDGWTEGCGFTSLSKILYGMGAWVGFNLDGGGSSTLTCWNESAGKPEIINRPSGALRDNGSNVALYYSEPVAMLGTYFYEDFDFLVQDVIDGETPSGVTAIDVLGDATFTAEHPCIPSGAGAWSLSTTNNASIGWEDGVAPQVASGTTVTFRDIRFREGSGTLSVAAGGKAILNGVTGLNAVETQNAADLVIAGVLSAPLRVSCASATNRNDVFATSTLSLAAATTMAGQIVCGTDEDLIAVASGTDGNVSLSWDTILEFGRHHGSFGTSTDSASVSVTIAETAGALPAGSRLKLTVTSEDGSRSAVQYQALNGPGRYTFDTSVSSLPSICQSGYNYTYIVEVTDANGVRVPHAETVSGAFSIGRDKPWFAAAAADDSATGGGWISKPAITNGAFEIVEGGEPGLFAASASRTGRVRVSTVATFPNPLTPDHVEMALADFSAMAAPPLGSLLIAEKADGEPAWFGLVRANGALAFKELVGPVALGEPVEIIQEVDWSSGVPRVSYLVAVDEEEAVRLADANGNAWFDSASSAASSAGRVKASGTGRVFSLRGEWIRRTLDNGTVIMAY